MLDLSYLTTAAASGGSFWQGHLDRSQLPLSNHMALMGVGCQAVNNLRTGCAGWVGEQTKTVGTLLLSNEEFLLLSVGGGLNQWEHRPDGLNQWRAQRKTTTGWHAIGLGDVLNNPLLGADLVPLLLEFSDTDEADRNIQPVFLVLVPSQYTILTVVGADRLLHAGIHFESRPGVMIFRDHPERWLPAGPRVIKLALQSGPLTSDFVLSAEVSSGAAVSSYYRQLASPGALLEAACAAAGLVQVKESGVIAAVLEKPTDGCVYTLEKGGWIDVPYAHAVLEAGDAVVAGQFIGASPLFYNTTGTWWIDVPWGRGVDLSAITPWALFAPNEEVAVECVGTATQIYLQGVTAVLEDWWAACAAGETTSTRLSTALGLTDGDIALINPVWLFAQYVWGSSALVVNLNASGLQDNLRARMSSFLNRERPLGKLLLVLDTQAQ